MRAVRLGLDIAIAVACGIVSVLLWRQSDTSRAGTALKLAASTAQSSSSRTDTGRDPAPMSMPAEPATSGIAPKPVSSPSDAPGAAVPSSAHGAYGMLIERFRNLQGAEKLVTDLTQTHETFMSTPDDPTWARDMEQRIAELINGQPEAASLEISSITCRSLGCEIQVLGTLNDAKLLANGAIGGWQAVTARVRNSRLLPAIEVQQTFVAGVADRTAYITMLRRLPTQSDAAAPDATR
jgi:hypothetical protein